MSRVKFVLFLVMLLAGFSLACSLPDLIGGGSPADSQSQAEDDADVADDDDGEAGDDDEDDSDIADEPAAAMPYNDEFHTAYPLSDMAVVTASGLVYEDLEIGSGPAARAGDTLSVRYTGYLEDGTVFDSNLDSGTPFEFVLGSGTVIPGWDEGLVGMRAGGSRVLVIPPELAYGSSGSGDVIPPDETLTFTVSLVEIK